MSLKILGGFARGQILAVPKGEMIRPTSVMLRRRVFDFFQDLSGVSFVDLCAGSGAMGFEAWSRGAKKVYLNEPHRHVLKVLEENRENLLVSNHHDKSGEILCSHALAQKWLVQWKKEYALWTPEEQEETILFLDPPYAERAVYLEVINLLLAEPWYFGQLWVESDTKKGLTPSVLNELGLTTDKLFEQGESYLLIANFPPVSSKL